MSQAKISRHTSLSHKHSATISVPASGSHMGRNGLCQVQGLELWLHESGTVDINTMNSRQTVTNGAILDIPVDSLIDALEALKAERQRQLAS